MATKMVNGVLNFDRHTLKQSCCTSFKHLYIMLHDLYTECTYNHGCVFILTCCFKLTTTKLLWLAALALGSQAAIAILVAFPIGK